jgi:predicted cupin superfamily sugar epimerase
MQPRAVQLIESLRLIPHPEGGYYREIWRASLGVSPSDARGLRAALTTIYFLLPAGAVSRWHRVRSDEVWIHIEGAPLELLRIPAGEWRLDRVTVGPLAEDQTPVECVPANSWQAARSLGSYTLACCAVGPGFEFADFEMMRDQPALAARLRGDLPGAGDLL